MNSFEFVMGMHPMAVFIDSPPGQPAVGLVPSCGTQHFSDGPLGFLVQSVNPLPCSLEEQLVLQLPPWLVHAGPAETIEGLNIKSNKNRAAAKNIFLTSSF